MAGAGYKVFNTGDVLTASDVNTFLQEQVVMVFASAAARTSALSGVLAEGMVTYLQDTNSVEVYNGTAFVGLGSPTLQTYTPVVSQNGNRTATITYAQFQQVGKFVTVQVQANVTNAGTAANKIRVTLPIAATLAGLFRAAGSFLFFDSGTDIKIGTATIGSTTQVEFYINGSGDALGVSPSIALASGDIISFTITYEVA